MQIILYLLVILSMGSCTDEPILESRTAHVGDTVNLTCARKASGSLFWIRLVPGAFLRVLKKTSSFDTVDSRITASKEPGTFVLHIVNAKESDTGVYYCVKTFQRDIIFLKRTDLRVEVTEPHITSAPSPQPGVSWRCSILSDSGKKQCPEEKCVCCFKAGAECHPRFNCTQANSSCGFDNNTTSSDAGTYFCSVVTSEEIFSGNKSKLNSEACHSQGDNTVLHLLCAALALSLIVIAYLFHLIKKLKENSYGGYDFALQANTTASANQESQQTDEDSLVYSVPAFTCRQDSTSKAGRRDIKKSEEEESIYSNVRTLEIN